MKNNNATSIFLIEMIAVICFFAVCSSICIQAFAKANRISRDAEDLNRAVIIAQSEIEKIKAEPDNSDAEDTYTKVWNRDWSEKTDGDVNTDEDCYIASVETVTSDNMRTVSVTVKNKDEEIYSLSQDIYLKP